MVPPGEILWWAPSAKAGDLLVSGPCAYDEDERKLRGVLQRTNRKAVPP